MAFAATIRETTQAVPTKADLSRRDLQAILTLALEAGTAADRHEFAEAHGSDATFIHSRLKAKGGCVFNYEYGCAGRREVTGFRQLRRYYAREWRAHLGKSLAGPSLGQCSL